MGEEEIKKLLTTTQMSTSAVIQKPSKAKSKAKSKSLETEWCQKPTCGKLDSGSKLEM